MRIRMLTTFALICALATWTSACERGAPAPLASEHDHAEHHHEAAQAPPAKESDEPVGSRIETGSFLLAVAPAQSGYRIGKVGEVEVALERRGEWHVNQEYPMRVDLRAGPGVTLKRNELVKADAKEFGEDKVRFLVGVEPSATGEHEVTCDVSFAMCTEENCILEKRTVSMQLKVE
jgi:hypothetical protein